MDDQKLLLFRKWDTTEITINDIGLKTAISLKQSILPLDFGRSALKRFNKADENIVERFSPEIDILLYRCTQEALNNVIKHSEATDVTIDIIQEEREIRMRIKDNGKGFDTKEHFDGNINGSGIGLLGMKERVSLMNGSLRIHSEENKGFELEILVPFIKTNNENSFSEVAKNV